MKKTAAILLSILMSLNTVVVPLHAEEEPAPSEEPVQETTEPEEISEEPLAEDAEIIEEKEEDGAELEESEEESPLESSDDEIYLLEQIAMATENIRHELRNYIRTK